MRPASVMWLTQLAAAAGSSNLEGPGAMDTVRPCFPAAAATGWQGRGETA